MPARQWPPRSRPWGAGPWPSSANVGRWEELDHLVDTAYGEFGRVDVLVNNAGMSLLYGDLAEVTETMWEKVVGLNLEGPVPPDHAGRPPDGGGRRRLDHQRLEHRVDPARRPSCFPTTRPRPVSTR